MAEQQQHLQALSEQYQKLEGELQTDVQSRQRLESQQQENKAVQKEFASLKEEANIYKLVGPVLLKQEKTEAVMAVDARLEFIENEIKRVEKHIKDTQEENDKIRAEIIQIQSEQPGQGAQQQVAG